jgi:hypothetical protein
MILATLRVSEGQERLQLNGITPGVVDAQRLGLTPKVVQLRLIEAAILGVVIGWW